MLNSHKIAKNTAFLYIRMFLIMGVTLLTSRIVLQILGVDDFGIYNIVGSIVVFLSFLNGAVTTATQRFLTFELATNNLKRFRNIFSTSIIIYAIISLIILFFAETIGLWILNSYLNIPEERMYAANWVYQLSIFAFIFNLMRAPFNAAIIAHERMSFYAYMGILEVFLKLFMIVLISYITFDKLILYGFFIAITALVINIIYIIYCTSNFWECKFKYSYDREQFQLLLGFSGWSMFGGVAVITTNQGVNFLINIFFGVALNAALGIANQVGQAVNQFITNFQIAFNPQITKSYAANNHIFLNKLVFRSARISFMLFLIISLPLLIEMETILKLWLTIVPNYAVPFCRLIIISFLIETLSGPLWMLVQATGKIKTYQLIISSIFFLNILLTYILFRMGFNPISALIVRLLVTVALLFVRLILLKNMVGFPMKKFIIKIIFKMVVLFVVSAIFPILIHNYLHGISGFLIVCVSSIVISSFIIYFGGLNAEEKNFIKTKIFKLQVI